MSLLSVLTLASLLLAGAALALMLLLVLVRWRRHRQELRETQRRDRLVLLALEYLEEPEFIPAFRAQLRPADQHLLIKVFTELLPKVRGDYAERVVHLMRELGLAEVCLDEVRARQWWRRAEACRMLRHFPDPRALEALAAALEDPQAEVRLEAARGLVQRQARHLYRRILERFAQADQRESLAVADLVRSMDVSAAPELLEILGTDTSAGTKRLAMGALAHLGHLPAVEAMLRLAEDPAGGVRAAALQALGQLGDPRALPVVRARLRDPEWEVRAQAAHTAGALGAQVALPGLRASLEDGHWWVRYYAGEALLRLGRAGEAALREAAVTPGSPGTAMAEGLLREKGLASA